MPVNKLFTHSCEVRLYRARPGRLGPAQWRALAGLLDESERRHAQCFRLELDRRAYVLAHGLRRVALAQWLAVPAAALVFGQAASGQPQLLWPAHRTISFSHTHTREGALLAMSQAACVGVDMESCSAGPLDRALLEGFIVLPESADNTAKPAAGDADAFYFYWTALEAFWKGAGRGLQSVNPRLHIRQSQAGHWQAWPALQEARMALAEGACAFAPAGPALIVPVSAAEGCIASLALCPGQTPRPSASPTSAAGTAALGQGAPARHQPAAGACTLLQADLETEIAQFNPLVWQASPGAGRH
jgi:phosphopantetheinyl transferase